MRAGNRDREIIARRPGQLPGTRFVGAIHGRLLTAWSVAGILGPVLVNYLNEQQVAAGVPKGRAYDQTMYLLAGLLVAGFICNALVRPVAGATPVDVTSPDVAPAFVARRPTAVAETPRAAAPLRAADVGISVDTAVDIAKESADIILLEKSLLVLHEGVVEGRRIFANIVKYIRMGASSNFGNMFSVLGASLFLPFLPMAPLQILTNNLLYDFSQTAIPTDQVDAEYLTAPRRWDIDNLFRFMLFVGPISSVFDYATFALMLTVFDAWSNPALFQTGWFVESLLTQTLIIHVIRTARVPFVQSHASPALIATTLAVCAAGIALPYSALGPALGFVPLPWTYWPALAVLLLAYCALAHAVKAWFVRRWGL